MKDGGTSPLFTLKIKTSPQPINQQNESFKACSFHYEAKCTLAKMVVFTELEEDGIDRELEWENLRP